MSLEAWRLKLCDLATQRGLRQLWYQVHHLDLAETGYISAHIVAALHANGQIVRPLRTGPRIFKITNSVITTSIGHDELWVDVAQFNRIALWLNEALHQPGTREMNLGELARIAISNGEAS